MTLRRTPTRPAVLALASLASLAALGLAAVPAARADTTFTFTTAGDGTAANFFTVPNGVSSLFVTLEGGGGGGFFGGGGVGTSGGGGSSLTSALTLLTVTTGGAHNGGVGKSSNGSDGLVSLEFTTPATPAAVSEPSTLAPFALAGLGLLGLTLRARKSPPQRPVGLSAHRRDGETARTVMVRARLCAFGT